MATPLDETSSDTLLAQLRVEMTALGPYKSVCLLRLSEFAVESTGVVATPLDDTSSDTLLAQLRVEMTALRPYKSVCVLRLSEFGV